MNKKEDSRLIPHLIATARLNPAWCLLTTRNFGFLWLAQVVSQIGDGVTKVALIWFIYELTGSALKMTIVGLLQTIPPLLLGPVIGVFLDRLPKKAVMIWVDLARALLILLIPSLYILEALTLERLYFLIFVTAIFSTAFGPALASGIPLLVKPSQLMAANGLIQSTTNIGVLFGPACSGLMIAFVGAQNVLYIDAATFLVSAFCLMAIRSERMSVAPQSSGLARTLCKDLITGIQFVFIKQRMILGLVVTSLFYTLGASAFVFLLPVFVKDELGLGSVWLGWLWSSLGVGMIVASSGLTWVKQVGFRERLHIIAGAMTVGAVTVGCLTLLQSPVLAFVMVGFIGGSLAIFTPIVWSLLQEMTPKNLQGRVFTVVSTAGMASAAAGIPAVGWIADTAGSTIGFVGIALALLGTALVTVYVSEWNEALTLNSKGGCFVRKEHSRWSRAANCLSQMTTRQPGPVAWFRDHLARRYWVSDWQTHVPRMLNIPRAPPSLDFAKQQNG